MSQIELIATSTFGLESIIKDEIIKLGYEIVSVEDGKVTYKGDESAIAVSNLWLRSADRVLLKIGEFKATTFNDLFEATKALPWDEWIDVDGKFVVNGKSVKSALFSISDCQSIVEKAIIEKLKTKYKDVTWFSKSGARYRVQVALLKDIATLTIDTSGDALHKRGYRQHSVEAPLKETLAAAMIELSYWTPDRVLQDPFCGSGTIPIEAALIGRNIAPGLNRSFDCEQWPCISKQLWKTARTNAFRAIDYNRDLLIYASDIDPEAVETAKNNAIEAGVDDCIIFETRPISAITVDDCHGVLMANPPYGKRIGESYELIKIYKEIRRIFRNKPTWSLYLITSDERFEETLGKKANKTRKLYNGRIKVNYYQYFGQRPPKKKS